MPDFQRKPLSRGLSMRITPLTLEQRQKRPNHHFSDTQCAQQDPDALLAFQRESAPASAEQPNQESDKLVDELASLERRVARLESEREVLQRIVLDERTVVSEVEAQLEERDEQVRTHARILLELQTDIERLDGIAADLAKECTHLDYSQSFDREMRALDAEFSVLATRLEQVEQFKNAVSARYVQKTDFQTQNSMLLEELRVIETAVKNFQFSSK